MALPLLPRRHSWEAVKRPLAYRALGVIVLLVDYVDDQPTAGCADQFSLFGPRSQRGPGHVCPRETRFL